MVTIRSSLNRVFFMAPSWSEDAVLAGFSWSEKRQSRQLLAASVMIDDVDYRGAWEEA